MLNTLARGINFNPPVGNWRAVQDGLPLARVASTKAAGINAIRGWTDVDGLMTAYAAGTTAFNTALANAVAYARNIVDDGFFGCLGTGISTGDGTDAQNNRLKIQNPADPLYAVYRAVMPLLYKALYDAVGDKLVQQLINEPPTKASVTAAGLQPYATSFVPGMIAVIRAVTPAIIGVMSSDLGYVTAIADFNPAQLDNRVILFGNGYYPGREWCHQGQIAQGMKHIYGLPWPTVGDNTAMKATVAARVDADGTITDKAGEKTRYNAILDLLYNAALGTKSYIQGIFNPAIAWQQANGWPLMRLCVSEYGGASQFNHDGSTGTSVVARAAYDADIVDIIDTWGIHRYAYQGVGDFNLIDQTSITDQSNHYTTELLEANKFTCPVPATISDLAAPSSTSGTITVTFTPALDATRYEYRTNGGSWTALPSNNVITGLTGGTSYTVEVRGKNNTASGPASNLVTKSTTSVVYPAWIEAFKNGAVYPILASDFGNAHHFVNETDSALSDVASVARSTPKCLDDTSGVWHKFAANVMAITDKGLSVEPLRVNLFTNSAEYDPVDTGGITANGSTVTLENDTAKLTAAGFYPNVAAGGKLIKFKNSTAGIVWSILNVAGGQGSSGTIGAVQHAVSAWALKVGSPAITIDKGGAPDNVVVTSTVLTRVSFISSINNNIEFQQAAGGEGWLYGWQIEYGAAPTSPILGSSRAKDAVSLTAGAQAAINAASLIKVDTGSGLTTTTAAALATLLDGGNVIIKSLVAYA